jgi:hypothetical protein
MKTTRTQFLATIATGLAAAALKPTALLGAGAGVEVPDARTLKSLVGEVFRFHNAWRNESLNLVLTAYREAPPRIGTNQFTLTFVAPGGESLREGTYTVDQPIVGTFPVFIVPTGLDEKGQALYRADFNLLVSVTAAPAPVRRR